MSQRILYTCILCMILSIGAGCATSNKALSPEQGTTGTEINGTERNSSEIAENSGGTPFSDADFYAEFEDDFSDEFEDYSYDESMRISDPLEGWNRACFQFNDFFLVNIAKPVYNAYDYVTPDEIQQGASNFFHNLLFPVRFVNALLQGEPLMAGVEFSRFVINSTLGIGGLFDVTKDKKPVVEPDIDGFGQTLGRWGVGEGCYIVWPFVGPSTLRDSAGWCGDYFLDPKWVLFDTGESIALSGYRILNDYGSAIDAYETFKASSVEPYIAVRNAYIQMRRDNLKRSQNR